jgi:hypothetical protein
MMEKLLSQVFGERMFKFIQYFDWIGYTTTVIGLLWANRNPDGWLIAFLGSLILMCFGYHYHFYGMFTWNLIFLLVYLYSYFNRETIRESQRKS